VPKLDKVTRNELRLLALIAFRDGEITEERCCELIGCKRTDVREEMRKRTGMCSPYTETHNALELAAMWIVRLSRRTPREDPVRVDALKWLNSQGLIPTPMREPDTAAGTEGAANA